MSLTLNLNFDRKVDGLIVMMGIKQCLEGIQFSTY